MRSSRGKDQLHAYAVAGPAWKTVRFSLRNLSKDLKSISELGPMTRYPLSGAKRKSKPPGEIAPDRMVVRSVGELARIGDADLGLRGELQIAARFDQRGVARYRNTQDIEP